MRELTEYQRIKKNIEAGRYVDGEEEKAASDPRFEIWSELFSELKYWIGREDGHFQEDRAFNDSKDKFEIKKLPIDTNKISDGYHTFGELYEHRIVLYIALCKLSQHTKKVWMSDRHSDGSVIDGWFLLGINTEKGNQITYHLPISKWDECTLFASTLFQAPEFDGHTSEDVLKRISELQF